MVYLPLHIIYLIIKGHIVSVKLHTALHAIKYTAMHIHGRGGQLQFSDNERRQQIYTSCSYSSEPACTTRLSAETLSPVKVREV